MRPTRRFVAGNLLLCLALAHPITACDVATPDNLHHVDCGNDAPDADVPTPIAPVNAGSPLGTNLNSIVDWSREWAFVNAFKSSRAWSSARADGAGGWNDGRTLPLDDQGWVRALESDQIARTLMFWNIGDTYPAGRYVVLYDGEGTLRYRAGANLDSAASTPGRDVIDVDPSVGGIGMDLIATSANNHLRNIRVIMPGGVCSDDDVRWCDEATPCATGSCESFEDNYDQQIFHPLFLDRIKTYSTVRFMNWMDTNNSQQVTWADRPQVDDARWSLDGAPVEIMVALANRLHADPWFTLPHQADDNYMTQFASVVHETLEPDRQVYIEYSNELWNNIFPQAQYCQQQGLALGLSTNNFQARLFYQSQRSVEMFRLFETAFGGTDRLIRVMGSQAANAWVSGQLLDFGDALAHTDALAIAPYFGNYLGATSQQARVEAMTVDDLATELRTVALPSAMEWISNQGAVAAEHGVALMAYEAGQHLAGYGGVQNNDTINALFDSVNGDPRMGAVYTEYLQGWRDAGGTLLANYLNCGGWGRYGRWGALEYLTQPRSESPKFDALQTFIENNERWW